MSDGLTTGWVKVAQSGKTIDGREIKAEALISAAKNYSKDIYCANVYPEHNSNDYSYGTVEALQYKQDTNGVVSLYAILKPNYWWQSDVRYGQNLFTSVALLPNYDGKNNWYMYSLGATNNPASLGIEQLQFSKKTKDGKDVDLTESIEMTKMPDDKPSLFSWFSKQKHDETDMDKEALAKLQEQFAALEKDHADLKELFKSKGDPNTAPTAEQYSTLQSEYAELKEKYSALGAKQTTSEKSLTEFSTQLAGLKTQLEDALKEVPAKNTGNDFNANGGNKQEVDDGDVI